MSDIKSTFTKAFPSSLNADIEEILSILGFSGSYTFSSDSQIVNLDNENLSIPYRIYFDEPNSIDEQKLSEQQKNILNCFYTRHHNGFVRQRRLELLLDKTDYFITPFVLQLLGEYVLEILFIIDTCINEKTRENYRRFINDNKVYFQQIESKVVSYWNVYYRRPMYPAFLASKYENRKDYIGQIIIDRIKENAQLSHPEIR